MEKQGIEAQLNPIWGKRSDPTLYLQNLVSLQYKGWKYTKLRIDQSATPPLLFALSLVGSAVATHAIHANHGMRRSPQLFHAYVGTCIQYMRMAASVGSYHLAIGRSTRTDAYGRGVGLMTLV